MADATNSAGVEEKLDVSKVYFLPAGADVATSIGRVDGRHRGDTHASAGLDHRGSGKAGRGNDRRDVGQGPGQQQADPAPDLSGVLVLEAMVPVNSN